MEDQWDQAKNDTELNYAKSQFALSDCHLRKQIHNLKFHIEKVA